MRTNNNHYSFGSPMPGRTFSSDAYRYGFNGKENDGETVGTGEGSQDYGMRIYNPCLGRFLSIDPLTQSYPWYTPYQFSGNKPIKFIDLDGMEEGPNFGDMLYELGTSFYNWLEEKNYNAKLENSTTKQILVGSGKFVAGMVHGIAVLTGAKPKGGGVFKNHNNGDCLTPDSRRKQLGIDDDDKKIDLGPGLEILEPDVKAIKDGDVSEKTAAILNIVSLALPAFESEGAIAKFRPRTDAEFFLVRAFKKQGVNVEVGIKMEGFKQAWSESGFDYEVRIHKSENTGQGNVFRVARRKQGTDASGQGFGWEYLDGSGNWHPQSTLKPGKKGNANPKYNNKAAKDTHIKTPQ